MGQGNQREAVASDEWIALQEQGMDVWVQVSQHAVVETDVTSAWREQGTDAWEQGRAVLVQASDAWSAAVASDACGSCDEG